MEINKFMSMDDLLDKLGYGYENSLLRDEVKEAIIEIVLKENLQKVDIYSLLEDIKEHASEIELIAYAIEDRMK